jgi:predicted nucleotidyltransferase
MDEVQDILNDFILKVKNIIGNDLDKVIVYGSYARGDYHKSSDIDIMILTHLPEENIREYENKLYDLAFDFQMEYLVDISVMLVASKTFEYWLGALPFYDNVNKEGIKIA